MRPARRQLTVCLNIAALLLASVASAQQKRNCLIPRHFKTYKRR